MLRSIDMQQILLQTTTVAKIQQVQQQHADVEKAHFALQFQKEMDQKKEKVQDTKESEEAKIREEEKKRQQKGKYESSSSSEEEDRNSPKKEKLVEMDQGKILDLIA